MADAADSPPPSDSARKKRVRGGVDTSLIIDAPRKRKHLGVELGGPSTRHGARSGSPNPATIPATDPEGLERVKEQASQLYDRLMAQRDPHDPSRPLHSAFTELPSREDYPDYYQMIKKPISFAEVKAKLDAHQYACLADFRLDINQIYVNAKRYNAPGSQIFLDAKKQHKLLKDTYAVMTGEAPPPEEQDEHEEGPQQAPRPKARETGGGSGGGGRAATLRPWLDAKLEDVLALEDANGRNYAENFQVLPDRDTWPDYYRLIAEPMAFDIVRQRVLKGHYKTVEPFYQDVMTIFENAMFYNEDSSRIWKDAMVLKKHFGTIMQEEPPEYVPSKKAKKRPEPDAGGPSGGSAMADHPSNGVQASDMPAESSEMGGYDDEGASEDEEHRDASAAPAAVQSPTLASVAPLNSAPAPISDLYALPGRSPATPAITSLPDTSMGGPASPNPKPPSAPHFPPPANGVHATSPNPAVPNGPTVPGLAFAGRVLHNAPVPAEPPTTFHPRLVARHLTSATGSPDPPHIVYFELRCFPGDSSLTLDNDPARQHALTIPIQTERVEIKPVSAVNGTSGSRGRIVAARTRPAALVRLAGPTPRPAAANSSTGESGANDLAVAGGSTGAADCYTLKPRKGLSTIEFVVGPAGPDSHPALEEGGLGLRAGEEVYRLFLTR